MLKDIVLLAYIMYEKKTIHYSCEIEDLVEIHLRKLCVIARITGCLSLLIICYYVIIGYIRLLSPLRIQELRNFICTPNVARSSRVCTDNRWRNLNPR